MPKVSVIIPVYNTEKYLKECLDSIVNQTLKDIEIICVDDGSTDNSLVILKEYEQKDERIKIITQENQGQGCARNNALQKAIGDYILFADSDDYIRQDSIELIYNKAINLNLDMISYCGTNFDDITKEYIPNIYYEAKYLPDNFNIESTFNYKDENCKDFLHKMAVSSCLTAYKRDFINDNKIKFPEHFCFEDNVFFCKALFNAEKIGILKDILYYRRIHSGSTTQNWAKNHLDYVKIASSVLDFIKSKNIPNEIYNNFKKVYSRIVVNKYNSFNEYYRKQYYKPVKNYVKTYSPDYLKRINKPLTVYEKIFSLKSNGTHKVLRLFGLKLKIKSNKLTVQKRFNDLEKLIKKQNKQLKSQEKLILDLIEKFEGLNLENTPINTDEPKNECMLQNKD